MDQDTPGKWDRFAEVYNDTATYPRLDDVAKALGITYRTARAMATELRALRARGENVPIIAIRMSGYHSLARVVDPKLQAAVDLSDVLGPEAARAAGVSDAEFSGQLKRAAEAGLMGAEPVLPGFRISRTAVEQDAEGDTVRTWVEQKREHGAAFEVPAGHTIKGVSALVNEEGREVVKWIKTAAVSQAEGLTEALQAAFAAYEGLAPLIPAPTVFEGDLLTLYPLPDLHIGMQSWGQETGEHYDLKIATARTRQMAADLIAQSRPSRQAVILGLGDLFHMNDQKNMTPRSGHILDVDGRWPKVYEAGIRMIMDIIEMAAQKHERVLVRILPGNHDPDAAGTLAVALRVFYAANPRVEVDSDPSLHWFHRFGEVQFGATHGHTMKPEAMAMMLATDRREDWGATHHKHFFFGHIHHERAKEIGPVRVESFNTIAAKDAYAHGAGHRSGQALNALTFHRARGEIGRHRINLRPTESRLAA